MTYPIQEAAINGEPIKLDGGLLEVARNDAGRLSWAVNLMNDELGIVAESGRIVMRLLGDRKAWGQFIREGITVSSGLHRVTTVIRLLGTGQLYGLTEWGDE